MGRGFQIAGETLVLAKLNPAYAGFLTNSAQVEFFATPVYELGLAHDSIWIEPHFKHQDIHTDDFGPFVPPEVMTLLTDVTIRMRLIHYDDIVLQICMAQAMGGVSLNNPAGIFGGEGWAAAPAGTLIGNGQEQFTTIPQINAANNFITLFINPGFTLGGDPFYDNISLPIWIFYATYLTGQPHKYPYGTSSSIVEATWRAIPYSSPYLSSSGGLSATEVASAETTIWELFYAPGI